MKKWLLLDRKDWFFEKKTLSFLQTAKNSQFDAESNRLCRFSQNVQELVFFWKKIDWFFEKKLMSSRSPEVAKLHYKATEKVQILRTFENWVFSLKTGWVFSKKKSYFSKRDKGSKFAVECDRMSKFSQNVRVLVFLKKIFRFSENKRFS